MSVADPDRQIKQGRRHLDPEIKGGREGGSQKIFFQPFWPHFGPQLNVVILTKWP